MRAAPRGSLRGGACLRRQTSPHCIGRAGLRAGHNGDEVASCREGRAGGGVLWRIRFHGFFFPCVFFFFELPVGRLVLGDFKKLQGGARYNIVRVLRAGLFRFSQAPFGRAAGLPDLPHMVQFWGRFALPCTFLGGGCSDFVAILPKLFTP